VRHKVGGGRGADGRGARRRRQRRSPVAGRRKAEQEEAFVSGGGMEWRMQWREVGRAAKGRADGMGLIDRNGGGRGVKAGGAGLNRRASSEGSSGHARRAWSSERYGVDRAGRTGTQG
jgi:hypothetical protein